MLGTGRKDGPPQLSTVMYDFNGTDFVVSIRRKSAKWVNSGRKSHVALIVFAGRRQLVCYGNAERLAGGASDSRPRVACAPVDVRTAPNPPMPNSTRR